MIGFDDLDQAPVVGSAEEIRKAAHIVNGGESTVTRTCPKCGGRKFRTYGYVNIRTYPCGWCKQTGKVTDAREANIARAIKAEATHKNNVRTSYSAFVEANADVVEFLGRNADWSDFYRSMKEQLWDKGTLSENQVAAIRRGMEKQAARKVEKEAAKPVVDVSAIEKLFDNARESGLKKLAFRTMHIDISAAKETSRNPGALYVKHNGEYAGKIAGGKFHAVYGAKPEVLPLILEVAADPLGMARFYGKQTGKCSCCGRELTDPVSVANGIGPICESKWGL